MPLSNTLRRMVQAHNESTRDPLGLDAKLQEYFMQEDPFKFSKGTRQLILRLLRQGEDPHKRDPEIFHASQAANCRRQQVAVIQHHDEWPEKALDLSGMQRTTEGRWSHVKWQAIFFQMGLLSRAEFFVYYKPWKAGGSPDGGLILPWLDKKNEFLLEVKSMSRYRFEQALRAGKPEPGHVMQTHTYIQALDLDDIVYLYENRDTQDWKIFYQKRDLTVVKNLRRRFRYMQRHIDSGDLPKPDCALVPQDPMYRWCPIRDWCKERLDG